MLDHRTGTFAWDVPGNLLKASNDSGVQGYYAYDGHGRRLESKEGSTRTFFAYSGTDVIYEYTSWPTMVDYAWSAGMRISKATPTVSYYLTDGLAVLV
jgi:YD repeat-containing protein